VAVSIVHLFVSTGRFSSFEALREFIDPTYTDDGDFVPSTFIEEVRLDDYEPGCIETVCEPQPKPIRELLAGVSYAEQWLKFLDPRLIASEAICVFQPNTIARPANSSLYAGAYYYKSP